MHGAASVVARRPPSCDASLIHGRTHRVGEGGRRPGPGAQVARAVRVAAAQAVGTDQRHHLLIAEAHAAKDGTDVVGPLARVRQAAIRRAVARVGCIGATRAPRDGGPAHLLDCHTAGKGPEVGVGDPRELLQGGASGGSRGGARGCTGVGCRPLACLMGSSRSRAMARPAFAACSHSGLKRMVAPLLPPVPEVLS